MSKSLGRTLVAVACAALLHGMYSIPITSKSADMTAAFSTYECKYSIDLFM